MEEQRRLELEKKIIENKIKALQVELMGINAMLSIGVDSSEDSPLVIPIRNLVNSGVLSGRVGYALLRANINTTLDLTYITKGQLLSEVSKFGKKSMKELEDYCKSDGIKLGSKANDIPIFVKGNKVRTLVDKDVQDANRTVLPKGCELTVSGIVTGSPYGGKVAPSILCETKNGKYAQCSRGEIELI